MIGLSKIPRLVEMFSRRLQVQERLTNQIARDPVGRAGPARGRASSCEATSSLHADARACEKQNSFADDERDARGDFATDARTRMEFLELLEAPGREAGRSLDPAGHGCVGVTSRTSHDPPDRDVDSAVGVLVVAVGADGAGAVESRTEPAEVRCPSVLGIGATTQRAVLRRGRFRSSRSWAILVVLPPTSGRGHVVVQPPQPSYLLRSRREPRPVEPIRRVSRRRGGRDPRWTARWSARAPSWSEFRTSHADLVDRVTRREPGQSGLKAIAPERHGPGAASRCRPSVGDRVDDRGPQSGGGGPGWTDARTYTALGPPGRRAE